MPAQIDTPADGNYYILSYQGNTNIYKRLDLKKELSRTIIATGGENLHSYTDSTIVFEFNKNLGDFRRMKEAISEVCNRENVIKVYFSLLMCATATAGKFIYVDGSAELDDHYQALLDNLD